MGAGPSPIVCASRRVERGTTPLAPGNPSGVRLRRPLWSARAANTLRTRGFSGTTFGSEKEMGACREIRSRPLSGQESSLDRKGRNPSLFQFSPRLSERR
jgi:hypothetical protein